MGPVLPVYRSSSSNVASSTGEPVFPEQLRVGTDSPMPIKLGPVLLDEGQGEVGAEVAVRRQDQLSSAQASGASFHMASSGNTGC